MTVTGTAAISGVVVDATTSKPVAGALVRLQHDIRQRTAPLSAGGVTLTDAKGRFVFRNLPARRYAISVTAIGYFQGLYGRDDPDPDLAFNTLALLAEGRIALSEGQWFRDAEIRLWPPASMSGTVRDERGDPVVGQYVRVLGVDAALQRPAFSVLGASITDDRGMYAIGQLAPGRYLAVVLPFNSDGLDGSAEGSVAYARTFFPSGQGLSGAAPVSVRAGEHLTGLDVTARGFPARRVSGRVEGPSEAWTNLRFALAPPDEPLIGTTSWIGTAWVMSDGAFEFPNVPAGKYVLTDASWVHNDRLRLPTDLRQRAPYENPYHARVPLEVAGADVTNVVVPVWRGGQITGRVIAAPGASPTAHQLAANGGPASLSAADGNLNGIRVSKSGDTFVMSDLFAREVYLRGDDRGVGVKSVLVDGRDVTNRPLDLRGGASYSNVEVTVADLARVSGVIRDGRGPAPRSAFMFFPVERVEWDQVRSRSLRLGFIVTPGDGSYAVTLPGGRYHVIALPDSRRNGWERHEFLEAASTVATVIDIEWGETKTLDLQLQDVVPR
jgi:hypothetical protein